MIKLDSGNVLLKPSHRRQLMTWLRRPMRLGQRIGNFALSISMQHIGRAYEVRATVEDSAGTLNCRSNRHDRRDALRQPHPPADAVAPRPTGRASSRRPEAPCPNLKPPGSLLLRVQPSGTAAPPPPITAGAPPASLPVAAGIAILLRLFAVWIAGSSSMAEHRFRKAGVVGSNPPSAFHRMNPVAAKP